MPSPRTPWISRRRSGACWTIRHCASDWSATPETASWRTSASRRSGRGPNVSSPWRWPRGSGRVDRERRIVAFPFHDWRKAQAEGFRTRDAHLLEALARRPDVSRILVVDRPSSATERWFRGLAATASGVPVARWHEGRAHVSVTQVAPKVEVLDIALPEVLGPIRRRRGWWFDVFHRSPVI